MTAVELARLAKLYRHDIPRQSAQVMMNILDSHDTDRWFSMLENPSRPYDGQNKPQDGVKNYNEGKPGDRAYRRGLAAVTLQFAWPGSPNIWYGTELGMWGADDPHSRKPMWWEDLPNDDPEEQAIAAVRVHFMSVAALRKANPALRRGDLTVAAVDAPGNTVAFRREYQDNVAFIVANGSDAEHTIAIPVTASDAAAQWEVVHAGTRWPKPIANRMANRRLTAQNGALAVTVRGSDCAILIRR
jgi:glycosidase